MKFMVKAALIAAAALASYLSIYLVYPDVAALKHANPTSTSFIEYRQQQWDAGKKEKKPRWKWVPYSGIAPSLRRAVVIAEDGRFWNHGGFDFTAIRDAIETDIKERRFKFGASTISQQLVKNLYLSPSKNPLRKLKEALITWRLERALTKRRILELYLNVIEWGDGVFGAEAAARHHFGKSAAALSAEESARLAAIIPNPLRLRPTGSRYVDKRARRIQAVMAKSGSAR